MFFKYNNIYKTKKINNIKDHIKVNLFSLLFTIITINLYSCFFYISTVVLFCKIHNFDIYSFIYNYYSIFKTKSH